MPKGDPAGYLPNVLKARGRAAARVFDRLAKQDPKRPKQRPYKSRRNDGQGS